MTGAASVTTLHGCVRGRFCRCRSLLTGRQSSWGTVAFPPVGWKNGDALRNFFSSRNLRRNWSCRTNFDASYFYIRSCIERHHFPHFPFSERPHFPFSTIFHFPHFPIFHWLTNGLDSKLKLTVILPGGAVIRIHTHARGGAEAPLRRYLRRGLAFPPLYS